ncbi:substrate-binding domain-containing protein [Dongia deserti]|uniref:substrate-binding domain-containing protein n=1 Tax=Dongia deserti TaxID=2268030 RepID=UPI000E650CAB|nr:substrate-binding domain-containing protein [Dongia deserti]
MSSKVKKTLAVAAAGLLLASGYASAGTTLKLGGSAAVGKGVIVANQAAIEKDTGLTLDITVNGDANGLKLLNAGEVDVAMLGAPIEFAVKRLNAEAPGSINPSEFVATQVGSDTVKFIVHPSNPVKTLTDTQLKEILTGKITSWKDVGGPDQPILVVTGGPGLGARAIVVNLFLSGTDIVKTAREVQQLGQVAQVVAQAPTAIGYGNGGSITDAVAVIPGVEVVTPLSLVTRGAPSPEAQKLIKAATKYAPK